MRNRLPHIASTRSARTTETQVLTGMETSKMRPTLNKWIPLRTRFKVVKTTGIGPSDYKGTPYTLIIEFPEELRKGWYPWEIKIQLRTGRGYGIYWNMAYPTEEVKAVIDAVRLLDMKRLANMLTVIDHRERGRRLAQILGRKGRFGER